MPERLECVVLQKARYINTLTFTFLPLWEMIDVPGMRTSENDNVQKVATGVSVLDSQMLTLADREATS